jgi:hypothetical protein
MQNAECKMQKGEGLVILHSAFCILIYHPQQSVLYPHAGHRQTACIRNMSAPHRSQGIESWFEAEVRGCGLTGAGSAGGRGSGMAGIIASAARQMPIWTVGFDSCVSISDACRYPGHDQTDLYNLRGLLHRKLSFVMSQQVGSA